MENQYSVSSKENLEEYLSVLKDKTNDGFVVLEENRKLPFAVLFKEAKPINHTFNFLLCCLTLGLWSFVWFFLIKVSYKSKQIIVAIDEDGNTFEDNCYRFQST